MRYCSNNICLDEHMNEGGRVSARKHNAFADIVGWQRHNKIDVAIVNQYLVVHWLIRI